MYEVASRYITLYDEGETAQERYFETAYKKAPLLSPEKLYEIWDSVGKIIAEVVMMTDKEIDELFVRKDLYDANSARLEALMRATVAENRTAIAEMRGDFKELKARVDTGFDAVKHRIDDLQSRLSRSFTIISIVLAGVGILIALPQLITALMPVIEKLMK